MASPSLQYIFGEKMTTKSTKKLTKEQEIAQLKAQLAALVGEEAETTANIPSEELSTDSYISVMSLLPYPLNLSTKEGGQGNIKKFTKFGEIKRILYSELLDIIEVHPNFLEAGYFYILSPAFIRKHGLDDIYSKILTKEKIQQILSTNSEECLNIYKTANEAQQEVIIQLLIDRMVENMDSVNLNMVDKIARFSKIDLMKKVEDIRQAKKLREGGEEEKEE